ncbi:MAG: alpha-amylase family glycosyl hydrolase [Anaerolineales bacterium]|nr:alpha-amylase family glycosyl hydrolase [Anaerolineales bacterium]
MKHNHTDRPPVIMEFHIARRARETYQFDETLYTSSGNVVFADLHAARLFAQKMNARRDLAKHPEQMVRAGEINAMGLIDEILHQVVEEYRRQRNPRALEQAVSWLEEQFSRAELDEALLQFINEFPPMSVYRGQLAPQAYLQASSVRSDGALVSNRQIALEEMLMLWLANENPAFQPYLELFDDADLERQTIYRRIFPALRQFFDTQPPFGPDNQNLMDMLRAPALYHPVSLAAQLEFIRSRWGGMLSFILVRLLSGLDLIKEETRPIFAPGGPGPALVYEYGGEEYLYEPERFSTDLDWMPNLVLLAKNTYVWLDQLSRKYHRPIQRLDQVPEEELALLARWGFTGLWLIGLWERSPASQKIKQLRGNPEAVASAYSLFSYDIAADLGGEAAYQVLRERAWRHGIRLASDMVPNHMGIDSRWVMEHPDWFIQLPYSPFPTYSFNGPNLSWNDRVGIFLEDHYYDNTDAAVVFKRVDFWSGEERYIYHGNDGTSMPWNDTAQLNYLLPEVREAVIQTILHVARKFPIIRFDAAMTLAKRHFQRLWFPEPGSGGDIPSRAGLGMTKEQFDQAFPEEFWRMVVDRVAQEAPDTLLLAEAFWLMEGYFVRTLGMHRVYNSAFMNMLRDEKNQEYRLVMKNTLEFDPEILKRFVNFMNNPDERTAVDQFGKGDKYFGVCTLLATLPGLPMFGHGQVEGFVEKYGMEFRYPKWHEQPDEDLVRRHEQIIFPLLRRRHLFADVREFLLYDVYTPEGYVNEDVFAYSNHFGNEAALVVYHNRYAEARGWIHTSAAYAVKTGQGDEKTLVQRTLAQGLGLRDESGVFTIFRDHVAGLEYIRSNQELCQKGLYVELGAYHCRVYLDFRQVEDGPQGLYGRLAWELQGRGVPSIEEALREMVLQPVLYPFRELINPGMLGWLIQNRVDAEAYDPANYRMALDEVERKSRALLEALRNEINQAAGVEAAEIKPLGEVAAEALTVSASGAESPQRIPREVVESIAQQIRRSVDAVLSIASLSAERAGRPKEVQQAVKYLLDGSQVTSSLRSGAPPIWGVLLSSLLVSWLGRLAGEEGAVERSRSWLDEWLFAKQIATALGEMGVDKAAISRALAIVRFLVGQQDWFDAQADAALLARRLLQTWSKDDDARRCLLVHSFEGAEWFNKEAFEELAWWSFIWLAVRLLSEGLEGKRLENALRLGYKVVLSLLEAEQQSGYQMEKLLAL